MRDRGPVLQTVTRTQGANAALRSGEVLPRGFRFAFEEVPVLSTAFRRMVRELEYDVCEMALTTYLVAKEHGVAFTALPVFLVRGLHHGSIQVAAAWTSTGSRGCCPATSTSRSTGTRATSSRGNPRAAWSRCCTAERWPP
jgi:hypothetical protein